MTEVFEHVSCVIPNEEVSSAPDFIGIQDISPLDNPTAAEFRDKTEALTSRLSKVTIPTWFSAYATMIRTRTSGSTPTLMANDTLQDTSTLYNSSYRLLTPFNALSGGNRYEW
jgi:hypothetical protein